MDGDKTGESAESYASRSFSPLSGHAAAVTNSGKAVTWATSSQGDRFGQLGRGKGARLSPAAVEGRPERVTAAFTGGGKDSGHTALLSEAGHLFVAGCDRWQQLGLCSPGTGAAGYTWEGGRIWRSEFKRNGAIEELLGEGGTVRDVALGADHTVVLSGNQTDVFSWGRGKSGQLGSRGAPFVSAPCRADGLSEKPGGDRISAVCALADCSATLAADGEVMKTAGKCSRALLDGFVECKRAARERGLIK